MPLLLFVTNQVWLLERDVRPVSDARERRDAHAYVAGSGLDERCVWKGDDRHARATMEMFSTVQPAALVERRRGACHPHLPRIH